MDVLRVYGHAMSRNSARTPADRRMRRMSLSLAAAGLPVCVLGVVYDAMWLLGVGAWLLIAAVLIELVYRP
ncbi:hypothetical protein GCM10017674_79290 [Streptomyces gardneri]|uniref:Uncharacterized protein n=2 Tax=Streptomyces gardneri TaxID=66892 RepID=A0A4Y3RCX3_9ACTN|nr:hypothetical protein SGA01_11370 [Streptomyces gardneri]GHH23020.1 hypothetical protein GCM10017674_79290 [Streptomyces gardneri]